MKRIVVWCFVLIALDVASIVESLSNRLLIVGLGRVGLKVANEALAGNFFSHVSGTLRRLDDATTTTTTSRKDTLQQNSNHDDGIERLLFDSLSPSIVQSSSHILFTIPAPDQAAWHVIDTVIVPALATTELSTTVGSSSVMNHRWVGVLSTTGVYGNHNGAWVTEESECFSEGSTSSAGQLLEFEMFWKRHHQASLLQKNPVAIIFRVFRCAGIYGNSRSALHTVYHSGLTISDSSQGMDVTNRIHEDDLVTAIMSSMMRKEAGETAEFEIYNLSDNLPESRRVVMEHAARLLTEFGIDVATTRSPLLVSSKRKKRRETDRKLVNNEKMRIHLLQSMKYPTYKEGLLAILHHQEAPWQQRGS